MKKITLTVLGSVLGFLFLYHPDGAALPFAGDTPVREVNVEGRYAMMLPTYLNEGYELNDEASLQYQNEVKEVYVIVIDEPKQDFIDVFKELEDYDTSKSVLVNYELAQMQSIRENCSMVSLDQRRELKTGCGTAIVHDVNATQEGIADEMGFSVAFVEGRLNLYMIMTWTFSKTKSEYQADMDNMLASFRELSGAIAGPAPAILPASLTVPGFMTSDPKAADVMLSYSSAERKLHIVVCQEPFWKWDSIYAARHISGQSLLDLMTKEQQAEYSKKLQKVKSVSAPEKSRINGMDAQTFTLYGQPANETSAMYYKICCVQGKKGLYIIQAWTAPEKRTLNEQTMNEMINSFKEN